MNRTEERFLVRFLKRGLVQIQGAPPEKAMNFILSGIRIALADAADEDAGRLGVEVGMVNRDGTIPQPSAGNTGAIRVVHDQPIGEDGELLDSPDLEPAVIPRLPLVPVEQKSLLIIPGQEGFASALAGKPMVGTVEPLRLWREPKEDVSPTKWRRLRQKTVLRLINLVQEKLPESLMITPLGTQVQIRIERTNVISDVNGGLVKVLYAIPGQVSSSRSDNNVGGGILDPMHLSREVTETFCIEDKTVNWEQRKADIICKCEDTFRPREKELQNRTPAKLGPVELLLSGDPRRNAGGYGEVAGDPKSIDPRSEAGGLLVLGGDPKPERRRASGPVVPNL